MAFKPFKAFTRALGPAAPVLTAVFPVPIIANALATAAVERGIQSVSNAMTGRAAVAPLPQGAPGTQILIQQPQGTPYVPVPMGGFLPSGGLPFYGGGTWDFSMMASSMPSAGFSKDWGPLYLEDSSVAAAEQLLSNLVRSRFQSLPFL
jgi:hypothetical protein